MKSQMADFDRVFCAAKVIGEKFGKKTAVTFFGSRFGTEEGDNAFESRRVAAGGNVALAHQFKERSLVRWPIFGGAIDIADFWRRRKERLRFGGGPPPTRARQPRLRECWRGGLADPPGVA